MPSSGKAEIPKDFHLGLKKLAERLQVQVHDRAPVTIEACRIVVEKIVQESLRLIHQENRKYFVT